MDDNMKIYEVITGDDFEEAADVYYRKRKYRHLPKQIQEVISNLQKGIFDSSTTPPLKHSEIPTPYDIYKMRLANPDAKEGKSGGYRIIYMIKTKYETIVLLTIYSKSDRDNISDREIETLIAGYFMSQLPEEED